MTNTYIILILSLFLIPIHAFAQVKEIVSEGTYNMGDGETPSIAESRALLQAKRVALEQAGTYVESYTKIKNIQVTEDEIQVLTSGIIEVEILDKKRSVVDGGFHFWIKIKSKINPDKIQEMAGKVKEKSVVEDYKKIQEAYERSRIEIAELSKQLAKAKSEKEKKTLEIKISDEEKHFQANEWRAKGYQYGINSEYEEAIKAFTAALALNPNYEEAYYGRGIAFYGKRLFDKAIKDFSKAIKLNSNADIFDRVYKARAYFNRGNAHFSKGQNDKAIADYSSAIALDSSYFQAYFNRSVVYKRNNQNKKRLDDFNQAIAINPNVATIPDGFILEGQMKFQ